MNWRRASEVLVRSRVTYEQLPLRTNLLVTAANIGFVVAIVAIASIFTSSQGFKVVLFLVLEVLTIPTTAALLRRFSVGEKNRS
jgi:hypothetical protein